MITKRKIAISLIILVGLVVAVSVIGDLVRHRQIKIAPSTPRGLDLRVYDDLFNAHHGLPVDWSNLKDTLAYLDDFWLAPLLRIVYRHGDQIDAENAGKIRRAILGFRYWMDQPGEDSRCYWSENHQILYASAEYLAGQKYPNAVFTVDGRTGREHLVAARRRVLAWLGQRWHHGFAEWYSNVYYVEDVAALCNLIDFCDDQEMVVKSRIVLDLLLYDVATQSLRGTFVSTMGRAYAKNRKSGTEGNSMRGIIQNIWGFGLPVPDGKRLDGCFLFCERYQVPRVIEDIGRDTNAVVIKASQGLDLSELAGEQRADDEDARIMRQWGMEAFSNPEVIEATMNYVERHRLFSNGFLAPLQVVDFKLLSWFHRLPALSRWLDPVSNGTPLQRANTYTYRTRDYLLASVQRYHPGTLNNQHHVWIATLSDRLSVFTAHPPLSQQGKTSTPEDPNYWVGPGHLPDTAQHENVCLLIYRVPEHRTLGEKGVSDFTHAWFPQGRFDRVELKHSRIYGQLGNVYIALLGGRSIHYRAGSTDDLIQPGRETAWVCEISSANADGDFASFIRRVEGNPVSCRDGILRYQTGARRLELNYGREFRVNGVVQDSQSPRHDSPYAQTPRNAQNMILEFGGHRLRLDFDKQIRSEE